MVWEIVRRGSMTVDRILFQSEESLLFGISGDGTELSGDERCIKGGDVHSSNLCSGSAPMTQSWGHSPPSTYL